jgi:hypothetical protein
LFQSLIFLLEKTALFGKKLLNLTLLLNSLDWFFFH